MGAPECGRFCEPPLNDLDWRTVGGYHSCPMKRILAILAVPALCAGVSFSLVAQDSPAQRTRGKVLLLLNERSFEGDVEYIGEVYRVRRGAGEIVVPAGQALRLCAD